jgi:hypothetical protein
MTDPVFHTSVINQRLSTIDKPTHLGRRTGDVSSSLISDYSDELIRLDGVNVGKVISQIAAYSAITGPKLIESLDQNGTPVVLVEKEWNSGNGLITVPVEQIYTAKITSNAEAIFSTYLQSTNIRATTNTLNIKDSADSIIGIFEKSDNSLTIGQNIVGVASSVIGVKAGNAALEGGLYANTADSSIGLTYKGTNFVKCDGTEITTDYNIGSSATPSDPNHFSKKSTTDDIDNDLQNSKDVIDQNRLISDKITNDGDLSGLLETGSYPGLSNCENVVYRSSDYTLFVARQANGVSVFDAFNDENILLLSTIVTADNAMDVQINGNVLYVAESTAGLGIYDITDPKNIPVPVYQDDGGTYTGLTLSGNYLFVTSSTDFIIYDISTPAVPVLQSITPVGDTARGRIGLNVALTRAYVACNALGIKGYDITNKAAPSYLTTIDSGGDHYSIHLHEIGINGYAFAAADSSGMHVYNVTSDVTFSLVTTLTPGGLSRNIDGTISNSKYYIELSAGAAGLFVYDVTTIGSISLSTSVIPGDAKGTDYSTGKIYVANTNAGIDVYAFRDTLNIDHLKVNSSFNIGATTTIDRILDEDTMVSNSDTALATQQSIRAYVASAAGGTLNHNLLSNLTTGDVHTQYVYKNGRVGGQVVYGGTASNNNLELRTTSAATKGSYKFPDITFGTYNERLLALDNDRNLAPVDIGSSLRWDHLILDAIQDIRTTAYPAFEGATLGNRLRIGNTPSGTGWGAYTTSVGSIHLNTVALPFIDSKTGNLILSTTASMDAGASILFRNDSGGQGGDDFGRIAYTTYGTTWNIEQTSSAYENAELRLMVKNDTLSSAFHPDVLTIESSGYFVNNSPMQYIFRTDQTYPPTLQFCNPRGTGNTWSGITGINLLNDNLGQLQWAQYNSFESSDVKMQPCFRIMTRNKKTPLAETDVVAEAIFQIGIDDNSKTLVDAINIDGLAKTINFGSDFTITFPNIGLSGVTDIPIYADGTGQLGGLTVGSSLNWTSPTLDTIQDIQTTAIPTFAGAYSLGKTCIGVLGASDDWANYNSTCVVYGTQKLPVIKGGNLSITNRSLGITSGGCNITFDNYTSTTDFGYIHFTTRSGDWAFRSSHDNDENTALVMGVENNCENHQTLYPDMLFLSSQGQINMNSSYVSLCGSGNITGQQVPRSFVLCSPVSKDAATYRRNTPICSTTNTVNQSPGSIKFAQFNESIAWSTSLPPSRMVPIAEIYSEIMKTPGLTDVVGKLDVKIGIDDSSTTLATFMSFNGLTNNITVSKSTRITDTTISENVNAALHIHQLVGTAPSVTAGPIYNGSIVITNADIDGKNGILFKGTDADDHGYIKFDSYDTTYSYWGTPGPGSSENSALVLGCENNEVSNVRDKVVLAGINGNIFASSQSSGQDAVIPTHRGAGGRGANILFLRSRGTRAAQTNVASGDILMSLEACGYNSFGSSPLDIPYYDRGATIQARVDGTPSQAAGDMPTEVVVSTRPDNYAGQLDRMRIRSDGGVQITDYMTVDASTGTIPIGSVPDSTDATSANYWQSFTMPANDARLESFTFTFNGVSAHLSNVRIYRISSASVLVDIAKDPLIYRQDNVDLNSGSPTFTFPEYINLEANAFYAIYVERIASIFNTGNPNTNNVRYQTGNPYAGGRSSLGPLADFTVTITYRNIYISKSTKTLDLRQNTVEGLASRGTSASPTVSQPGDRGLILSARLYTNSKRECAKIILGSECTNGAVPSSTTDDAPGSIAMYTTPDYITTSAPLVRNLYISQNGIVSHEHQSGIRADSTDAGAGFVPSANYDYHLTFGISVFSDAYDYQSELTDLTVATSQGTTTTVTCFRAKEDGRYNINVACKYLAANIGLSYIRLYGFNRFDVLTTIPVVNRKNIARGSINQSITGGPATYQSSVNRTVYLLAGELVYASLYVLAVGVGQAMSLNVTEASTYLNIDKVA